MTSKAKRILATATYTLKIVNDGEQGPQGPQGPQGEAKDQYDSSFMEGKTFWSTKHDSYEAHGSNVIIQKEDTSTMGGNVFQAQNETKAFSKNKIAIEENKVYKFKLRIRQIQDSLTGADKSKIYAGATTYDSLGNKLSVEEGSYFVVSGKTLTVNEGWIEITCYMSTKARDELVAVDKEVLCPAVKAFDTGTKAIKPMFIVNSEQGDGIAQVDSLIVEDYTQEWNSLNLLKDKLNNNSQEVFDALTNNGKIQGIYMQDGQLYINGQYINARNLRVIDKNDTLTLGIDEDGNVTLRATTLEIGGKTAASQDDVSSSINKINVSGRNLLTNTSIQKEIINNGEANIIGANYDFVEGINYETHIKNNEVTVAFEWEYIGESPGGTFMLQTNEPQLTSFYTETISAEKTKGLYKETKLLDSEQTTTGVIVKTDNISGTLKVSKIRFVLGNKEAGWAPAPEDIDENKIDVGGAIDDVNNSNGQIQYPKLNIKGMIRFTDFDENLAENYIVKRNEEGEVIETTINGGRLETGSVKADKMELYNLSVIRRRKRPHNDSDVNCDLVDEHTHWEELDTSFQINDEGNVKASGTFSSFNFNEVTKDKGWQINENGDSIFNNTLIRGTVELPKAGMTNFDKDNLIPYTNFSTDVSQYYSKWDSNESVEILWHNKDGGYIQCKNTTLEVADDGVGLITPKITGGILANKQYTLSFKAKSLSNITALNYFYIISNTPDEPNKEITANIEINEEGSWKTTQHITFTVDKDYPNASILIGFIDTIVSENSNENGFAIKEIMLVEGDTPSMWYENSPVRIWSGASFDNRNNAPFQVLQDGSVKATRGEFGGTFTGKLEIGNIKIYDTISTPGVIEIKDNQDRDSLVRLSENESYFASPLLLGKIEQNNLRGFKTYIRYNTNQNRIDVLNGAAINFGSGGNKTLLIKNDPAKGPFINLGKDVMMSGENNNLKIYSAQSGKINVSIGNFKGDDIIDDASLLVDGNIQTNSLTIGLVKIYETPDKDGIDFFID